MIPRGFMRSERALSVSNVTIKQNTQRSKVVSNVKIKQIIFLHFISGGKSRRKLKKKKYLIVYHKIGLVDACFTIQLFESLFSGCLQKVFITVNHMCVFTSRSEMKHLTQGLCSSNALTFPKCSTNRSKNNSFITMPFHL